MAAQKTIEDVLAENPALKGAVTAAQYLATTAISYATGKGWITNDVGAQLLLLVPVAVIGSYGVLKAIWNSRQKRNLAEEALKSVPTSPKKLV